MKKAWITPEDYIPGTPGDDTLTGTSGRDTLDGGTGADLMTGGDGNDTYIVDNVGDVVVEVADGGRDTVRASISYTLASKVEKLVLTGGGNIDGTGNGQHNILTGNGAHNELSGRAGNDQLYGGLGNDTLIGGNGKDLLVGGSGVNDLHDAAGDGADTIDGTGGVDTLFADWSAVTTDIVWHNNPAATVTVLGNTITSMEMMVVDLGSGNDVVRTAGGWRDVVHGNGGNDNLGAPHRGDLWGDSGNDTLTGGVESNLHGGDGDDELFESASFGSGSCSGDGGNDTIHANGSRSAVSGGDGNDLILGGDGHNPMSGGAGNDTLYGGLGEDGLYGDAGDDWLSSGGTGFAVGTEDGLNGGDGNDTLVSAASFERMTGGTGTDLFLFGSAVWERGDWVMDFVSGTDKIGIAQSTLAIGDGDTVIEGAVAVAGPGGFATSAELVIITNPTGDAPSSIGSANSNYAVGDSVVFGVGSRIYVFTSMDGDAAVELNELDMVAVLDPLGPDNPTTQIGDYTFV